jgi:hypothetical protein
MVLCKRRIEKYDVERQWRPFKVSERRTFDKRDMVGAQRGNRFSQLLANLMVLLDQDHVSGAARSGLQPEHATTGKQIQAARPRNIRLQPVAQRLADPVACRSQPSGIRQGYSTSAPPPGNYSNLIIAVCAFHKMLWDTAPAGLNRHLHRQ